MANFYTDTPQFRHHLQHPLMKRIVELKRENYADRKSMITLRWTSRMPWTATTRCWRWWARFVLLHHQDEPNAEEVDHSGPTVENRAGDLCRPTQQNLDALNKAELMGMGLEPQFGGTQLPHGPLHDECRHCEPCRCQLPEHLDAAGLRRDHLSLLRMSRKSVFCASYRETMSMDLTEPDASSDLQAVMLKASYNEEEKQWYLNGVKRFITNGDADIHLVLARSEEGTKDAPGSLHVCL